MNYIEPQQLTDISKLHSLVEHRTKFALDFCELNVFETHQKAADFHLAFDGFTITSMLRGKKIMKLEGMDAFDYLPGESVLSPARKSMHIDFPEAEIGKPTQCTALVIDNHYLQNHLQTINEGLKQDKIASEEWSVNFNELILKNNWQMAKVTNKLLHAFSHQEPFLEYQVDTLLRELVLGMLKQQNLTTHRKDKGYSKTNPFADVFQYIRSRLQQKIMVDDLCRIACMSKSNFYRMFVETYGISPVQLINEERINYAKQLLLDDTISIKEVGFASGFSDPNYFTRIFKKTTGMSPGEFRNIEMQ